MLFISLLLFTILSIDSHELFYLAFKPKPMYIFADDASKVLFTVAQQHVVIVTQYLYQYVRGLDGEHVT